MLVFEIIIVGVLLRTLLEYLICVVWYFTHCVLHTPATEPSLVAVYIVSLHTAIEVHDVVLSKYIIVSCCETCVPLVHIAVCALVDTTVRKYSYRESIDVIWIFVEEWVILANGRIVHCAICHSLITIVEDIVLLACCGVLHTCKQGELNLLDRLVLQATCNTEVIYTKLHVVVLQLIEDVEWSIVACIVLVRIKSA